MNKKFLLLTLLSSATLTHAADADRPRLEDLTARATMVAPGLLFNPEVDTLAAFQVKVENAERVYEAREDVIIGKLRKHLDAVSAPLSSIPAVYVDSSKHTSATLKKAVESVEYEAAHPEEREKIKAHLEALTVTSSKSLELLRAVAAAVEAEAARIKSEEAEMFDLIRRLREGISEATSRFSLEGLRAIASAADGVVAAVAAADGARAAVVAAAGGHH